VVDDADPKRVADRVLALAGRPWHLARQFRRLRARAIAVVLRRFERRPDLLWGTFIRAFVAEASEDLETAWYESLAAIASLNTSYRRGSPKHRAKIDAILEDPRAIEAARATAATATEPVPDGLLEVLLTDGREASIDALIPTIDRALRHQGGELDRVVALARTVLPNARVRSLLDRLQDASEDRKAPALELAASLFGEGRATRFWLRIRIGSVELVKPAVPRIQANVRIDARMANPYAVSISEASNVGERGTYFDAATLWRDGLDLGRCDLADVPAYLERASERLGVHLAWDSAIARTNLRGRQRRGLIDWIARGTLEDP
jgi:hypothetical protein